MNSSYSNGFPVGCDYMANVSQRETMQDIVPEPWKAKKIVLRTSGLACPFPLDLVLTCVDSFVSKKYILWLYVSLIESYFFIQTFRK